MEAILRLLTERPITAVKNQLRDVVTMGVAVTNFETVNLASGLTSFTANATSGLTINGSASGDTSG